MTSRELMELDDAVPTVEEFTDCIRFAKMMARRLLDGNRTFPKRSTWVQRREMFRRHNEQHIPWLFKHIPAELPKETQGAIAEALGLHYEALNGWFPHHDLAWKGAVEFDEQQAKEYLARPSIVGLLHDVMRSLRHAIFLLNEGQFPKDTYDPSESIPLLPNEQALFDVLTNEGQIGPDLVAKLARQGITTIDESAISRMVKRPEMKARGVRHRPGAGYYRIQS